MDRTLKLALASLIFNIAFAFYHLVFGIITRSWWLFIIGIYYLVLSVIRFVVLKSKEKDRFLVSFTGWMLMILVLPLIGTVILSFVRDRGVIFNMIIMLAIAVYAFTKITFAAINWIKTRKSNSVKLITLRNISFADAFVSIFSLQRSMLVSFDGMTDAEIRIMNILTGSGVCIIVFWLGVNLIYGKAGRK